MPFSKLSCLKLLWVASQVSHTACYSSSFVRAAQGVLQPSFIRPSFVSLHFTTFVAQLLLQAWQHVHVHKSNTGMLLISFRKPSCTSLTGLRFASLRRTHFKKASVHTLPIILLAGVAYSASLSLCCYPITNLDTAHSYFISQDSTKLRLHSSSASVC